jgi:tetratricopeptide (TPR) repeat protein
VHSYLKQVALESPSPPSQQALKIVCTRDAIACAALQSRIARAAGDLDMQARAIGELKRAPSDNVIAKCELGRAYQANGELADARAELEACVQLDPSPQNHYRLGIVYDRLGLTEMARKQMELREAAGKRKSEETVRRQKAVETFQYVIK